MEGTIISIRIDKKLHRQMKSHDEINWSAVLRKSIIQHLEKGEGIDLARARRAAKEADHLRHSGIFDKGKSSVELIREWREKRK